MATGTINMYSCTSAQFLTATKDSNAFYWLTDTQECYIGSVKYGNSYEFVETLPTSSIAVGVTYYNTTDNSCSVYTGTEWKTVVPTIVTTLSSSTTSTSIPTAGAITAYVQAQIDANTAGVSNITWDATNYELDITKDGTAASVPLTGLITGASYSSTTGDITLTQSGDGDDIVLNMPVENFLSAASYDNDTQILTLTLNDSTEVEVDLGELVDSYTFTAGNGISITNTAGNAPSFAINISTATGNQASVSAAGLFVSAFDDSSIQASLDEKVDAVEGSSLITAEKLALIDTNASDISTLDSGKVDKVTGSSLITAEKLALIDTNASGISTNAADIAQLQSDITWKTLT